MRIGIDFDNTLVSYDALFHRVALEQGAIPGDLKATKLAVRDFLRGKGAEDVWTEMQGTVYGARMQEADAYPGALEFLRWAVRQGIDVCIISHKTRYPYLGTRHDLHEAARKWVSRYLVEGSRPLLAPGNVFFELSKEDKVSRITACACDAYIDDLPEILLAPTFPQATQRILFDPDGHHAESPLLRMRSWDDIRRHFAQLCPSTQ